MNLEQRVELWEHAFICRAQPEGDGQYAAELEHADAPVSRIDPVPDAIRLHRSPDEALRHARLHAMQWVHGRTGDAQGHF